MYNCKTQINRSWLFDKKKKQIIGIFEGFFHIKIMWKVFLFQFLSRYSDERGINKFYFSTIAENIHFQLKM
jgi:hypothetical protein